MKFLRNCKDVPNEKNLNVTIWTVGSIYDIFGFSYSEGLNEAAINQIKKFLRE